MTVRFGMGIIKGTYQEGQLTVSLENPHISAKQTAEVNKDQLEEFLLWHDYAVHKRKNGNISFEKIFMDNHLGEYLKKNGISQSYVASKLGVSRSYINQLCRAKNLEIATIYPILKVLNLSVSDIDTLFPPKNLEILEF